ncbi:hypothetical protein [Paracoccus sp. S3-43]|uniref:hypothetical protein n=1 Tax=Paracoccus sp. S3-43 TaxID=3030011 RepID=UPI0023AE7B40|nr:hypothetical protein [Paracoccus sp. S3-43]WEF25211.1 hypothetical protein PXD02_04530 [Paracoccus sp. S3-43]
MAIHLFPVCPAKADRAKGAVPVGEGQATGHPVDYPPGAIPGFAVVVSAILDKDKDFEIGRARKRYAMPGDVECVFRGIELDPHGCIYDLRDGLSSKSYIRHGAPQSPVARSLFSRYADRQTWTTRRISEAVTAVSP